MKFEFKENYQIEDLIKIVEILRDPVNGCPWDRVQTHESIRMNFLEETYEVLEAIDRNDSQLLCEELGDVLLQVALHSRIEEQSGGFGFNDVCDGICKKLITRHPHIFSENSSFPEESEVPDSWEKLKNQEKGRHTVKDELESVPVTLPALMKALKLQKRAARYGFGCDSRANAMQNIRMVMKNMEKCLDEAAIGQLLFAVVEVSRLAGVDPELALEKANSAFAENCEQVANEKGKILQADN